MSFFGKKNNNITEYADQIFNLLQKNLTHVVDNFMDTKFPAIKSGLMAWRPHVDMKETDKAFILKADIPGVERKDLEVSLSHDVLTISGERKIEEHKSSDLQHWNERFHGKFSRSFSVPHELVVQDKIDAKFENGVLTVIMKKRPSNGKEKKDHSKRIEIK